MDDVLIIYDGLNFQQFALYNNNNRNTNNKTGNNNNKNPTKKKKSICPCC